MKARPILFSTAMVKAQLAGTKTQTRRIVKPQPVEMPDGRLSWMAPKHGHVCTADEFLRTAPIFCPYGKPGDMLFVRESGWERPERTPRMMREGADTWERYYYDADGYANDTDREQFKKWGFKRRPSIHMPRWASRLTLRITDVRVDRLQAISEEDAIAEGIDRIGGAASCNPWRNYLIGKPGEMQLHCSAPTRSYMTLWESINGPDSWNANPWVWVVSFDVIHKNIDTVLKESA